MSHDRGKLAVRPPGPQRPPLLMLPRGATSSPRRSRMDPVLYIGTVCSALWWLSSQRDSVPLPDGARHVGVYGVVI